jgi:transglutaminase-like putative cysteine protease
MDATKIAPTPATADTPSPAPVSRFWRWLTPEDGWLTILLLAVVAYCVPWSIQNATPTWAPGLDILTYTTAAGLVLGFILAQQRLLSDSLAHGVAVVIGIAFAFQKTADAVLAGSRTALWQHVTAWIHTTLVLHESSDDNAVFLLFLAVLTFLLAYLSVRLVVRIRQPWMAALANGIVLLINLNWATSDKSLLLIVVFILSTLLLLVRFTLEENIRMWRARRLRFSRDLGWDFMQAGTIFAVIILILANALPSLPPNMGMQNFFTSPNGPLQSFENRFQSAFGGVQGRSNGFNFFGTDLQLAGSVSLPNTVILRYTLPAALNGDASQYLITGVFTTYDGQNRWSRPTTDQTVNKAGTILPPSTQYETTDTYAITLVNPPNGQHIFVPGTEPASFTVGSQVKQSVATGSPVAWYSTQFLGAGDKYQAKGYVSNATVQQLEKVQYPSQLSKTDLTQQYPGGILTENLANTPVAPDVAQIAKRVTSDRHTMYDAAVALEDYLRQFKYTTTVEAPPPGVDAVSWFLQRREGFCTYFATAMAVMGRSLGMPTRIAEGFSTGTYDQATNSYVVTGLQSHVWTQVYFGQYGWVNFEPTSSFDKFVRTYGNGASGGTAGDTGATGNTKSKPSSPENNLQNLRNNGSGAGAGGRTALVSAGLSLSALIILGLLALAFFAVWWRRLFQGLSPVTEAFARVTRLGAWAGAPPAPSQTPSEYAERLSTIVPGQRETLYRLSDRYARERWGNNTESDTLEYQRLYSEVRTHMTPVILRRLKRLPLVTAQRVNQLARRAARIRDTDDDEMR